MNLSELQAEIGRLLGDPSHDRWSSDVLTIRINLAQVEIQGRTNAVKTLGLTKPSITSAIGTALINGGLDIIRVHITNSSGEIKKLKGIALEQLDFDYPNWQQWEAGEPLFYYYDGTNRVIYLVPRASDEWSVTDGLRVWSSNAPEDLSDATDIPFGSYPAMVPYHMSIVHWVVAQCFEDDATPESLQKARFHRSGLMGSPGEYEKEIKRIVEKFDAPEDVSLRILWRPQGGRASRIGTRSKSNPLD